MDKMILLGDEAVGQAAIDAKIGGAFGYPGTPSTEIFEYMENYAEKTGGFCAHWSGNEKVAYEEALGMSYAGKRAIVTMKCVGLNVAMDPFVCSGEVSVNGGFVVAVADDPGMHSSQNEQDARVLADFAKIPCFEPSTQQDCYDMTRESFEISEKYKLPVMLRLVTRIAHSRAPVKLRPQDNITPTFKLPENFNDWILLPNLSRKMYARLLEKNKELKKYSENCVWNFVQKAEKPHSKDIGIIACGTAYNYAREAMRITGAEFDLLKIGFYPLPDKLIEEFCAGKKEVLVLEDSYPYLEERLTGIIGKGPKIRGRLDNAVSRTGELNPDTVLSAFANVFDGLNFPAPSAKKPEIPNRPPQLCAGCPHTDTFKALKEALATRTPSAIFSDIGCYTLAWFKPLEAVHACVEMGASVGMAKGASQGGLKYSVAVLGDSTYLHSGLTTTIGAVKLNTPMTLVILDNNITAMTGAQETLANGDKLINIVKGLGVSPEHIRVINAHPKHHGENVKIFGEELDYNGFSVVIAQRDCIQIIGKK